MADRKGASYVIAGSGGVHDKSGIFREITLPGGKRVHVMNRSVFESAVEKANKSLIKARDSNKVVS